MHTIGIGVDIGSERIFESIRQYRGHCRIVCYGTGDSSTSSVPCEFVSEENPGKALISDLMAGSIQAGIRGTLPAHKTLSALKTAFGLFELERIVLLESSSGRKFFLAPVGIDEGWTVQQKISLIRKGMPLVRSCNLPDRAGVLSGGRPLDDIGRHQIVDTSMADALLVCHATGASYYGILIEDALSECGLIIAPDGISGNLIFRTLVFAGAGASHGAPVVNLDKIFVDTSRVNPSYIGAIELASTLITRSAP